MPLSFGLLSAENMVNPWKAGHLDVPETWISFTEAGSSSAMLRGIMPTPQSFAFVDYCVLKFGGERELAFMALSTWSVHDSVSTLFQP